MKSYMPLWDEDERAALDNIFVNRRLSLFSGSYTKKLEAAFADKYPGYSAVALNSGTAALHLSLESLGVSDRDEVIVPSITYIATALAPMYVGATPVFADIRNDSFTLDVHSCERLLTSRTRAVIFVHLFGTTKGVVEVAKFCRQNGLLLIEDCAQSCGTMVAGKPAGHVGDASCFSFFETKALSVGEGGMLLLRDDLAAETATRMRHHGIGVESGQRAVRMLGYNYKPSELQSAIALAQFRKIKKIANMRQDFVEIVTTALNNLVSFQETSPDETVCRDKVSFLFSQRQIRDEALSFSGNIWVDKYWYRPLQDEPVFDRAQMDRDTPVAREFVNRHAIVKCSPVFDSSSLKAEMCEWASIISRISEERNGVVV